MLEERHLDVLLGYWNRRYWWVCRPRFGNERGKRTWHLAFFSAVDLVAFYTGVSEIGEPFLEVGISCWYREVERWSRKGDIGIPWEQPFFLNRFII